MKSFNVLDPETDICKSYFLEASAGTGKTYSIENIVLRLLRENYCTLDQMLIVTFTRAATRDLKKRIRQTLSDACEESRQIHQALLIFDNASIETIHGFCSRMLSEYVFEGNVGMDVIGDQKQLSNTLLQRMIFDFFRTGLDEKKYSSSQVKRVRFGLEERLLHAVKRGITVEERPDFSQLFSTFKEAVKTLPPSDVFAEFEKLSPYFKKMAHAEEKVKRFSLMLQREVTEEDFNQLIEDELVFVKALSPENKLKRVKQEIKSDLYDTIKDALFDIVEEASNPAVIFGRMVRDLLHLVEGYLESEELMRFDDLLKTMDVSVQNALFAEKIRGKYKAIIVDEFQDTDPLQWNIFKTLASSWDGLLYLVGDPKQSIYAFRNADIYTYLDAAEFLGKESHYSLQKNYRSTPAIVHALNTLFSLPGLIPLPRKKTSLAYPLAEPSDKLEAFALEDGKGAVHFCVTHQEGKYLGLERVESELIFPFLVEEIKKWKGSLAILVHTRYQGKRVAAFLKRYGVTFSMQQMEPLSESEVFEAFQELMHAVTHKKNIKAALGGPLLAWPDREIALLEEESLLEEVLSLFSSLRNTLFEEGFAPFIQQLLSSYWPGRACCFSAELLKREDGLYLYEELMHLAHLVLQKEALGPLTPEGVLAFLDEIKTLEFEEDSSIRRATESDGKSVEIMTMHASKGLEFDAVFALGLIDRTREPEMLVPSFERNLLEPVLDKEDARYRLYCEELDAEKMRQQYVVMTRAKKRLYVPVVLAPHVKEARPGMASPLELYLQKLGEPLDSFVDRQPKDQMTLSVLQPMEIFPVQQTQQVIVPSPKRVVIPGRPRYVHSFSSLAKPGGETGLTPPHDFKAEVKSAHTLPAGSDTGTLLHSLLEKIPFRHYQSPKEILPLLSIDEEFFEWKEVFADMVFQALHLPLDGFCLADVKNCYRECEFLYPTKEGYMKGVIDLAFTYQGKAYLLDWKSNWLGESDEAYSQENLLAAMKHHQYEFQAEIYREAFGRYLKVMNAEAFGGIFYVFLRGKALCFL